ncbi:MAG: biopolymer transporter ExbD [Verrucomicrobiales bacterium]|nr:biopolymer transporter ExbD [Verrucomicrobiales bacterium]
MARREVPQEKDPELDMSSMIDVSFLLLIYFIVTSTLDPKEADLGMTMPTSQSDGSTDVEIDQMTINVNSMGHIVVNDEVLDANIESREVPVLLDRLSTYAESARLTDSEPMVIIAADDAAKGQRFVDVLNALAHEQVRIQNVTISGFTED